MEEGIYYRTQPIHIIDQIMSSGKSTEIIKLINDQTGNKGSQKKFLVIVPILDEVDRYTKQAPNANFYQPNNKYDGQDVEYKSKKMNFMSHLLKGHNIVTTHSMFGMFDEVIAEEISRQGYHIVIDEGLTCIEPLPITVGTREALFDSAYISINPHTKRVRWSGPLNEDYDGPKIFAEIRKVLLTKEVYLYRDKLFVFQTPRDFFDCGKEYTILTYRFAESSNMWLYFEINKIPYNIYRAADYEMKQVFKKLITFVDPPKTIHNMKQRKTTFSGNWWNNKTSKECTVIRNILGKCLERRDEVSKEDMLYSCCKGISNSMDASKRGCHVTPKGYSGYMTDKVDDDDRKIFSLNWIPFNINATNKYCKKNYIIYMHNVFFNVNVNKWLKDNDIIVDEEGFALSMMIQCLWRTAIRNQEPIRVMIFSNRMKKLLIDWLDSDERIETSFTKYNQN